MSTLHSCNHYDDRRSGHPRRGSVDTNLNLAANQIGPDGAEALAGALRVNAVLTKLDLRGNHLGDAAKQSLRDTVARRDGFELLL